MELAAIVIGILGGVGGVVGGVAGILGWRIAVKTRRDTNRQLQEAPARARQQERLSEVVRHLAVLGPTLTTLNTALQRDDDLQAAAVETRQLAETIRESTAALTELTIPALDSDLEELLEHTVGWSGTTETCLVVRADQLAGYLERVAQARHRVEENPGQTQYVRTLEAEVAARKNLESSTRQRLSLSMQAVDQVRARVRELEAKGVGELRADD